MSEPAEKPKQTETLLGVRRTEVASNAEVVVETEPSELDGFFSRLIIPSRIGVDFQIVGISLGDKSLLQGPSGRPIPAVVFSELSSGSFKEFEIKKGEKLELTILNTSEEERAFTAAALVRVERRKKVVLSREPESILLSKKTIAPGVADEIECEEKAEVQLKRILLVSRRTEGLRLINIEVDGQKQLMGGVASDVGLPGDLFAPQAAAPFFTFDRGKHFKIGLRNISPEPIEVEALFMWV